MNFAQIDHFDFRTHTDLDLVGQRETWTVE
jgi:hypothetical protein